MTIGRMTMGERIAALRKRFGHTNASAFARRIGWSPQQLKNLEESDSDPQVSTLLKVARGLEVPIGVLTVGLDDEYDDFLERDPPRHAAELRFLSYDVQTRRRLLSASNPNSTEPGDSANAPLVVAPPEAGIDVPGLDHATVVSALASIAHIAVVVLGFPPPPGGQITGTRGPEPPSPRRPRGDR